MKESTDEGYSDENLLAIAESDLTTQFKYPVSSSSRVKFNAGVWHIINTATDPELLHPYRSYWVLVQSAGEENANGWSACAMTNSVMYAAGEEGEAGEEGGESDNPSYLYKSTDAGTTWTKINNITLNDSGSKIRSIACSDDGQKIILCRSDGSWDQDTDITTYFGAVYISEDGGVTWGEYKKSSDITSRYDSVAINVKSNEDGTTTTVYAVTCGSDENLTDGMIFISRDSGANWVEKSLPKNTDIYDNDVFVIGKDRNYSVAIDTNQNIFVSNFSGNIKCFYYNDGTLEERWSANITPTNPDNIQQNQFCTTASLTLSNDADGKQYLAFTEYGRTLLSGGITDISSPLSFNVTGYRPVIHIYVDGGNLSSPYYNFYDEFGNNFYDEFGNLLLTIDLSIKNDYVFHRKDGATTHPFYIDVLSSGAVITDDGSSGSGITGTETFKLDLSGATSVFQDGIVRLYCTLHPEMTTIVQLSDTGTLTNNMRNLSMTGTKLFGTYEVAVATTYENGYPVMYKYIPHLIEGSITSGFSGSTIPEYEISFSGDGAAVAGGEAPPDGDAVAGGVAGGVAPP